MPGMPQSGDRENCLLLESIRHRSCCVKVRYGNRQAAKREADKLNDASEELVNTYYCVFCNEFHNGRIGGAKATEKILRNIVDLLVFGFTEPCSICGKENRFQGRSKPAKG